MLLRVMEWVTMIAGVGVSGLGAYRLYGTWPQGDSVRTPHLYTTFEGVALLTIAIFLGIYRKTGSLKQAFAMYWGAWLWSSWFALVRGHEWHNRLLFWAGLLSLLVLGVLLIKQTVESRMARKRPVG